MIAAPEVLSTAKPVRYTIITNERLRAPDSAGLEDHSNAVRSPQQPATPAPIVIDLCDSDEDGAPPAPPPVVAASLDGAPPLPPALHLLALFNCDRVKSESGV